MHVLCFQTPGMKLEEAIARIEARITEHDDWGFVMEDGYLVRTKVEPDADASEEPRPETASDQTAGTQEGPAPPPCYKRKETR
jgi:hypothetical protein